MLRCSRRDPDGGCWEAMCDAFALRLAQPARLGRVGREDFTNYLLRQVRGSLARSTSVFTSRADESRRSEFWSGPGSTTRSDAVPGRAVLRNVPPPRAGIRRRLPGRSRPRDWCVAVPCRQDRPQGRSRARLGIKVPTRSEAPDASRRVLQEGAGPRPPCSLKLFQNGKTVAGPS